MGGAQMLPIPIVLEAQGVDVNGNQNIVGLLSLAGRVPNIDKCPIL